MAPEHQEGKHEIGLIPCVAFCVGTMIGAGVFTLSGIAIDTAGPSGPPPFLVTRI